MSEEGMLLSDDGILPASTDRTESDIPEKWIEHLIHFAKQYKNQAQPSFGNAPYIATVLKFLTGYEFTCLELAFCGNCVFEQFAQNYVTSTQKCGILFDNQNPMNFPVYRSLECKNYKFLHSLLWAYPNLAIIGGPYANKENPGLALETDLSLDSHKQYIFEKAIKGGGLPFCLNVFCRVFSGLPLMDRGFNISTHLNRMFAYFDPVYGDGRRVVQRLEEDDGVDSDDDGEYEQLHEKYIQDVQTKRYEAIGRLVSIIKPRLPQYSWAKTLTAQLCWIAKEGRHTVVKQFIELGAKLRFKYDDVLEECATNDDGMKVLIELFKAVPKEDCEDEDDKLRACYIRHIVQTWKYDLPAEFQACAAILLKKTFILTEEAEELLRASI